MTIKQDLDLIERHAGPSNYAEVDAAITRVRAFVDSSIAARLERVVGDIREFRKAHEEEQARRKQSADIIRELESCGLSPTGRAYSGLRTPGRPTHNDTRDAIAYAVGKTPARPTPTDRVTIVRKSISMRLPVHAQIVDFASRASAFVPQGGVLYLTAERDG